MKRFLMLASVVLLVSQPYPNHRALATSEEDLEISDYCQQFGICRLCGGCRHIDGECAPVMPVSFCDEIWPADTRSITCYKGRGLDRPEVDLSPLTCLTKLEHLSLVSGEIEFILPLNVVNLKPLASLTSLRTLELGHTKVTDVRPLAGLDQLRKLSLHASPVGDIASLSGLTQLEDLDLSCTKVTDLTPLAAMTRLEELDLTTTEVNDLSALFGLKNLRWLGLSEHTLVSHDQIEALELALPDLRITEGRSY